MRRHSRPSFILGQLKWFSLIPVRAIHFKIAKGIVYGVFNASAPITDPQMVVSHGGAVSLPSGALSVNCQIFDNYFRLSTRYLTERPGRVRIDGKVFEAYVLSAGSLFEFDGRLNFKAAILPPNTAYIDIREDISIRGTVGPHVIGLHAINWLGIKGGMQAENTGTLAINSPSVRDPHLNVDVATRLPLTEIFTKGQGYAGVYDPESTVRVKSPTAGGELYRSNIFKFSNFNFSNLHARGEGYRPDIFKLESFNFDKLHISGNAIDPGKLTSECYTRMPAVFTMGRSDALTMKQRVIDIGIGRSLVFCYSIFNIFGTVIPPGRVAPTIGHSRFGPVFDFSLYTQVSHYASKRVSNAVTLMLRFKRKSEQSCGPIFDNSAGLSVRTESTGESLVMILASSTPSPDDKLIPLPVIPGKWHTLIITLRRDSDVPGFATVWLDGVKISSVEGTGERLGSAEFFYIGSTIFSGSIANIGYWHRILNKRERDRLNSIKHNFNRYSR